MRAAQRYAQLVSDALAEAVEVIPDVILAPTPTQIARADSDNQTV